MSQARVDVVSNVPSCRHRLAEWCLSRARSSLIRCSPPLTSGRSRTKAMLVSCSSGAQRCRIRLISGWYQAVAPDHEPRQHAGMARVSIKEHSAGTCPNSNPMTRPNSDHDCPACRKPTATVGMDVFDSAEDGGLEDQRARTRHRDGLCRHLLGLCGGCGCRGASTSR